MPRRRNSPVVPGLEEVWLPGVEGAKIPPSPNAGDGGAAGKEDGGAGRLLGLLGFPRKATRAPFVDDGTGLPVDSDAPARRRPARRIGLAAGDLTAKLGLPVDATSPVEEGSAMLAAWPEVAGEELAAKLEPEKFVGGILYAFARNSAELFEIRRFKLRALEERARRHAAFAGLRQIRLRVR